MRKNSMEGNRLHVAGQSAGLFELFLRKGEKHTGDGIRRLG
jgi:hypothetical protein